MSPASTNTSGVARQDRGVYAKSNEEPGFKTTYQTVGRPPVTDHNINDEYMRDPPQNLPADGSNTSGGTTLGNKNPANWEQDPANPRLYSDAPGAGEKPGSLGLGDADESVGRAKASDVQGSVMNEYSVHSGNPVR